MIFCRQRAQQTFRAFAILSLFIIVAVIIHNKIGISSYIRSAYDGVSTELHSVQVSSEQPLSTSSKTNPRLDRHVTRQRRLPNVILVGVKKSGTRGHRALLIFPLAAMLKFCQIIRKLDLRKKNYFNTITAVMSLIC